MENYNYWAEDSSEAIEHHGILGMKWRRRRYQYEDGSLTPEGRKRYLKGDGSLTRAGEKELDRRNKIMRWARGEQIRKISNEDDGTFKTEELHKSIIKNNLNKSELKEYEEASRILNSKEHQEIYGKHSLPELKSAGDENGVKKFLEYRNAIDTESYLGATGEERWAKKTLEKNVSDLNDTSFKKYETLWENRPVNKIVDYDNIFKSGKEDANEYYQYLADMLLK